MAKKWSEAFAANPVTTIVDDDLVGIAQTNGSGGYIAEANAAKWSTVKAYIADGVINPANIYWIATNGDVTDGDGSYNNPFATPNEAYTGTSPTSSAIALYILLPGTYSTTDFILKPWTFWMALSQGTVNWSDTSGNLFDMHASWTAASAPICGFHNLNIISANTFTYDLNANATNSILYLSNNYFSGEVTVTGRRTSGSGNELIEINNTYATNVSLANLFFEIKNPTYETGTIAISNFVSFGITQGSIANGRMGASTLSLTKSSTSVLDVELINIRQITSPLVDGTAVLKMDQASFKAPTLTNGATYLITDLPAPVTVAVSKDLILSDIGTTQVATDTVTFTIPLNATTPFQVGSRVVILHDGGAGDVVNIVGATGAVTIVGDTTMTTPGQILYLFAYATNIWISSTIDSLNPADVYWISTNGSATGNGSFGNPFSTPLVAEAAVSDATPSIFICTPGTYTFNELRYKRNRNYFAYQSNTVFFSDSSGGVTNNSSSWATVDEDVISFKNISFLAGTDFSISLVASTITNPAIMMMDGNYFGADSSFIGHGIVASSLVIKSNNNTYSTSPSYFDCELLASSEVMETGTATFENLQTSGIITATLMNCKLAGISLEESNSGVVQVFLINSRPTSSPTITGNAATLTMDDASYVSPTLASGGLFAVTGGIRVPVSVAVSGSKTFALSDMNQIQYVSAAATLTVPLNATVPFPSNTVIPLAQTASGTVTVAPVSGSVTILSQSGNYTLNGIGAKASLLQTSTIDTWILDGNLIP